MLDQPRPNFPTVGFIAGTPFLTPEGYKPIEELRPGDVLLSGPGEQAGDHQGDDEGFEPPRWWEWN